MKKLAYIIIALLFFLTPFSVTAKANAVETKYGRAITDDVGLYTKSDGLDLAFYLPYSYYVKILEEGQPYSHVEIYGGNSAATAIDGYALTEKLYFEESLPINPYASFTLRTSSEIATIYANKDFSVISRRVFKDRTLKYYGFNRDSLGNYIYFVEYNDCLGYISETDVAPFNFVLHPTPLPKPDPLPPDKDKPNEKPASLNTAVKTIIIVCVCLAGLILLVVIFKPVRKKDKGSYYDENDYE